MKSINLFYILVICLLSLILVTESGKVSIRSKTAIKEKSNLHKSSVKSTLQSNNAAKATVVSPSIKESSSTKDSHAPKASQGVPEKLKKVDQFLKGTQGKINELTNQINKNSLIEKKESNEIAKKVNQRLTLETHGNTTDATNSTVIGNNTDTGNSTVIGNSTVNGNSTAIGNSTINGNNTIIEKNASIDSTISSNANGEVPEKPFNIKVPTDSYASNDDQPSLSQQDQEKLRFFFQPVSLVKEISQAGKAALQRQELGE